jgi:hypothetical protein
MSDYSLLVSGFDVGLDFVDDATIKVEVSEAGVPVFNDTIDASVFIDEDNDTYTEDLINAAARAAVDKYEASRGTLGEGAGVTAMRKKSYFVMLDWEDWYQSFKGTPFQEQATTLLDSYLQTFQPESDESDTNIQLAVLNKKTRELEYKMDQLLFEKMKADPGKQTVIVINAKVACSSDLHPVEMWLNKFENSKLEDQALALAQEYLDTKSKMQVVQRTESDMWKTRDELRMAMGELNLQALQQRLQVNKPTEGPQLVPSMMNDLAELAEGVSFDEPLEPMSEFKFPVASKKAESEDQEDVKVEVIENGQLNGDLGAEGPKELPLAIGDTVSLKKTYTQPLWGGATRDLEKGLSGVVESITDGVGDCYYVRFDTILVKVPTEYLK